MNVEYRHPTEADVEAMTEIINLSSRDLTLHSDDSVELTRVWTFGEKDFDPNGYLMGFVDTKVVAFGGSMISKSRLAGGYNDAHVSVFVVPEWRNKGIEKHLFNETFKYLRSKGIGAARFFSPESTGWRNDIANEIGMKEIRHGYSMVYKNKRRPLAPPLPEDYQFHHIMMDQASDSEISEFVEAFNDSFANHWNFSPAPVERFIKVRDEEAKTGEDTLRISMAKKGNEIAGICFYGINHRFNDQNDARTGWLNILGVAKPHRRQGLGRSLLTAGMCWLYDQGMHTMYLGMEAKNRKALELYRSLGFVIEHEGIHYELEL